MVNRNDLIKRLELDPNLIRRDLDACYASARYYEQMQSENENNNAFAATLLRRAAAHSLLAAENIEERDRIFLDAAMAYRKLNMPYSYILIVFVQGKRVDDFADDYFFKVEFDVENINEILQRVYLLIASTNRQQNRNWSNITIPLRHELESYRQKPVGILGLPISNYLDLFDALSFYSTQNIAKEDKKNYFQAIRRTIQPFLAVYNASLQQIRQNQYYWERLAVPFHPAEIDILSVLLYVYKSMKSQDAGEVFRDFINSQLLSEDARFLLNEILGDYIS